MIRISTNSMKIIIQCHFYTFLLLDLISFAKPIFGILEYLRLYLFIVRLNLFYSQITFLIFHFFNFLFFNIKRLNRYYYLIFFRTIRFYLLGCRRPLLWRTMFIYCIIHFITTAFHFANLKVFSGIMSCIYFWRLLLRNIINSCLF